MSKKNDFELDDEAFDELFGSSDVSSLKSIKKSKKISLLKKNGSGNSSGNNKGYFLHGPVDISWLRRAWKAGSAAFAVGIFLHYFCRKFHKAPGDLFRVCNRWIENELGASESTVRRGLKRLEEVDLISREKENGCHKVTIRK